MPLSLYFILTVIVSGFGGSGFALVQRKVESEAKAEDLFMAVNIIYTQRC